MITGVGTGVSTRRSDGPLSRPLRLLLLVVPAVVGLTVTAVPAHAAAAVTPTSDRIVGDVTADGLADQVTLGADDAGHCAARVRTGRAGGGFTGGDWVALPVRGVTVLTCPDLGVVLPGPKPAKARLAVAWSSIAPVGGPSVQFFRWDAQTPAWVYDGGTDGQVQPSTLRTEDVDGDGFGDLVEITDQGSGVSVFAGRGSSYRQVWSSAPSSFDVPVFADFDHHGGTDLVDGHSFFGSTNVGVTVVDGLTGAIRDLVVDSSVLPSTYSPQVVDVDHDGWADVKVRVWDADGNPRPALVFRNRADGTLRFTRV